MNPLAERTCFSQVLVHCAQGKSRSGTVSTAYVAAVGGLAVGPALALVQEGRRMAQPNSNFMAQLLAFERGGVFRRLRDELAADDDAPSPDERRAFVLPAPAGAEGTFQSWELLPPPPPNPGPQ